MENYDQYLIVRNVDRMIVATTWRRHTDADICPVEPQVEASPISGTSMVKFDGSYSQDGRSETEVSYLVDGAVVWVDSRAPAEVVAQARQAKSQDINEACRAHI